MTEILENNLSIKFIDDEDNKIDQKYIHTCSWAFMSLLPAPHVKEKKYLFLRDITNLLNYLIKCCQLTKYEICYMAYLGDIIYDTQGKKDNTYFFKGSELIIALIVLFIIVNKITRDKNKFTYGLMLKLFKMNLDWMVNCEMTILKLLDYKLFVEPETLQKYENILFKD
jgi:hypothetical protein